MQLLATPLRLLLSKKACPGRREQRLQLHSVSPFACLQQRQASQLKSKGKSTVHLPTANRKFTVWPYPLKPRQLNGKARSVPFSFGATSASQARALGGLRRPTMPRAEGFKSFRLKLKQILMVVRKVKLLRKAKTARLSVASAEKRHAAFPFQKSCLIQVRRRRRTCTALLQITSKKSRFQKAC